MVNWCDFSWNNTINSIRACISHRINWEENAMKANSSEQSGTSNHSLFIGDYPIDANSTKHSDSSSLNREAFLIAYACIMIVGTLCFIIRSFSFFGLCLRISVNLHGMIFRGVSRAKMIFFNNNPSGRILNRFAGDINNVDALLPNIMADVLDVSRNYWLKPIAFLKIVIRTFLPVLPAILGHIGDHSNGQSMAFVPVCGVDDRFLRTARCICQNRPEF